MTDPAQFAISQTTPKPSSMNETQGQNLQSSSEVPTAEAFHAARAKLKVFFGAAPGVGKTHAMLQAARERRAEGIEVAVGIVQTHGQAELAALLEGLEIIPCRTYEYDGKQYEEMDLDAILARQPQLVLIDDLAHRNAPGVRHAKRHLDVEELLQAGIHVYATVNVQHLESLNDVVAQITGVPVRETLPDAFLEQADELVLIDQPPEELQRRLREGKVYLANLSERTDQKFFRTGNLIALRELALRFTAERVDQKLQNYMRAHAIPGPWPAGERLMVCVDENPLSLRMVRIARRIAERRHIPWLAVYMESERHQRLSAEQRERIAYAMQLAEQLGGETATIPGYQPAEDLLHYARARNVTEIILGKPTQPYWLERLSGSLVGEVIARCNDIDILVITGAGKLPPPAPSRRAPQPTFNLRPYLLSTLAVVLAAGLSFLLQFLITLPSAAMIFLIAVLVSAIRWGSYASAYASLLSVLLYDFFLLPPVFDFTIDYEQDASALIIFLIASAITSRFAGLAHDRSEAIRQRAETISALYAFSHEISCAVSLDDALRATVSHAGKIVGSEVIVALPDAEEDSVKVFPPEARISHSDEAAARWCWRRGQPTGYGTETLAGASWHYYPLRTGNRVVGALGLRFSSQAKVLAPEQQRLLQALAGLAADAVARASLAQEMQEANLVTEKEHLRSTLLLSVAHDLRTPLSALLDSANSLLNQGERCDAKTHQRLLADIKEETERLNRFVANLLSITRLESGDLELKREWTAAGDTIGTALHMVNPALNQHQVRVEIAPDLPPLRIDHSLMEHVFANLIENAAAYSPPGTAIDIRAYSQDKEAVIEVEDQGPGVSEAELPRIFEKFRQVSEADRQDVGTGLGLSICRGFVEAHRGKIDARRSGKGTGMVFSVRLPIEPDASAGRSSYYRLAGFFS